MTLDSVGSRCHRSWDCMTPAAAAESGWLNRKDHRKIAAPVFTHVPQAQCLAEKGEESFHNASAPCPCSLLCCLRCLLFICPCRSVTVFLLEGKLTARQESEEWLYQAQAPLLSRLVGIGGGLAPLIDIPPLFWGVFFDAPQHPKD